MLGIDPEGPPCTETPKMPFCFPLRAPTRQRSLKVGSVVPGREAMQKARLILFQVNRRKATQGDSTISYEVPKRDQCLLDTKSWPRRKSYHPAPKGEMAPCKPCCSENKDFATILLVENVLCHLSHSAAHSTSHCTNTQWCLCGHVVVVPVDSYSSQISLELHRTVNKASSCCPCQMWIWMTSKGAFW